MHEYIYHRQKKCKSQIVYSTMVVSIAIQHYATCSRLSDCGGQKHITQKNIKWFLFILRSFCYNTTAKITSAHRLPCQPEYSNDSCYKSLNIYWRDHTLSNSPSITPVSFLSHNSGDIKDLVSCYMHLMYLQLFLQMPTAVMLMWYPFYVGFSQTFQGDSHHHNLCIL